MKRYDTSNKYVQLTGGYINSRMYDYWQKYEVSLAEPQGSTPNNFEVVLQAVIHMSDHPCSVNIDDVSLTPQCYSLGVPDLPPGEE